MYSKHGWRLARVLARDETLDELRRSTAGGEPQADESAAETFDKSDATTFDKSDATTFDKSAAETFEGVAVRESEVDAMWFTRAAQGGREAWELRLVGETAYALFELFEPDEPEEDRVDVRREMEARLREYAAPRDDVRRE